MGDLSEEINAEQEADALRRANTNLQRQLVQAKAKTSELVAQVYQGAFDAAVTVGRPKAVSAPKRDRRKSDESALLHLTDWQLGKDTAAYSTETCEVRVSEAADKTLKLAEIQRADHPVKECHILLGGDLVENVTIFPTQPFEVDSTAFEQVFRASSLIESVVTSLLEGFERVTVWEVYGNHGRIGRKGDSPREDNLDRIVCRIARDRLKDQDRLKWNEPPEPYWFQIVEVGKYRALLVHGDQIRAFGGNVPAYGILRKAAAWSAGVVPYFTDVYMGHFHQAMTLTLPARGRVFVTPSTESGSEYAREFVAAKGQPGQRLHFIDPRKGRVTSEHLLWFEEGK